MVRSAFRSAQHAVAVGIAWHGARTGRPQAAAPRARVEVVPVLARAPDAVTERRNPRPTARTGTCLRIAIELEDVVVMHGGCRRRPQREGQGECHAHGRGAERHEFANFRTSTDHISLSPSVGWITLAPSEVRVAASSAVSVPAVGAG